MPPSCPSRRSSDLGSIGSRTRNHCRDLEELEAQLKAVHEALANFSDRHPDRKVGPLAVNISPTFSTEEFQEHLKVCARYGTRIIVTSVGDPTKNAPVVRDAGLLHFHDATTIRFAEKAAAANVDGIRSEEQTSELQSLMRISYAVFCLNKQNDRTEPKHDK